MNQIRRIDGSGHRANSFLRGLRCAKHILGSRGEGGSAIVEMALSVSILVLLLVGISRLSIGLYAMDFLSQAAREGARWKIVRGNTCSTNTPGLDHCGATQTDIQNYVQALGLPFASGVTVTRSYLIRQITLDSSGAPTASWVSTCSGTSSVLCNSATADDTPGNQVTVTVSYTFPLWIPFVSGTNLPMSANSSMVIVQ